MALPETTEWTVVILGKWNRAIFQPKWLTENVFSDKQVRVELAMGLAPGMPFRIVGDGILVLPTEDRLVLGLTEVNDDQLCKMEHVAVKFLDLLSHTPVNKTGVNFGFRDKVSTQWITKHLPDTFGPCISKAQLIPKDRSYQWTFEYEDNDNVIVRCNLCDTSIDLKFNFDFQTPTATIAKEKLDGKLANYKNKATELLSQLFDLEVD